MTRQPSQTYFATCPRGLEPPLEAELARLGAAQIARASGGAAFTGEQQTCYRANLESRIATRILRRVAHSRYKSEQDIYEAAFRVPWHRWFSASRSIRVEVNAARSPLKSLEFVTLRIKDAVCDRFRAECGRRPDVDTRTPQVRIHAFLDAASVTLYLDTSGDPLYKRGYRLQSVQAPLRENLAAGIIALSGWEPDEPLLDPMCGGGTLLAEAAMIALGIAPGLGRGFGFERLEDFDSGLWKALRERARESRSSERKPALFGSDLHAREVDRARENLRAAGLEGVVKLKQANVTDLRPSALGGAGAGVIIMNPPYGVRVGEREELASLYPRLGDWLKQHFAGWRCYIFSGDPALPKGMHLRASRRTPLYNGPIECRLYEYRIVPGSLRRRSDRLSGPSAHAEDG